MKIRLFLVLILLTAFFGSLYVEKGVAAESASVQAAYIRPADTSEPSQAMINKIGNTLVEVQSFYASEMERHGYGRKTFAIDNTIGIFRSKYTKADYSSRTSELVFEEIIKNEQVLEKIYVVIVGGIDLVDTVHGGLAIGSDYACGGCKGAVILTASDRSFSMKIMAHELGHTFGLNHISHLKGNYLMGSAPPGDHPLMDYEAHWLNVHPFFNKRDHNHSGRLPFVGNLQPPEPVGLDWIHYFVDVSSPSGVHQVQLVSHNNVLVESYDWVSGRSDTAIFLVKRDWVYQNQDAWIHLIDKNGLYTAKYVRLEAPPPQLITVSVDSADSNNLEGMPLTLTGRGNNSLNAKNSPAEWDGWVVGVWEKTPNNNYPQRHEWYNAFPYIDIWEHWFYSVAQSRFVWDISNTEFTAFNAHFYLPNTCGNVASVRIEAYADGKQIYSTETLHGGNAQNKEIVFTIPSGATELELRVDDLGDITCDHFVFGNPRLISDTVSVETVDSNNFEGMALTLTGRGNNSLTPINNRAEWDGWIEGVWEKLPNSSYPAKPQWYLTFPYQDIWEHWFYAHAKSRIVWDISDTEFTLFNAQFYLPNTCGNVASVRISAFADGKRVYTSPSLNGNNAQNKKVAFTIPSDATELELQISELGENTCDHFVFGNARLTAPVGSAPQKMKGKVLTQWAKLKDRQ